MGAGGIIHQHAIILQPVVKDPSVYTGLPAHCQARVDAICAKPLLSWTAEDVSVIYHMIGVGLGG